MLPARIKVDIKQQTLGLSAFARAEFARLLTHIPEEQRHRPGKLNQWAPKDEIAHLAYWIALFATNVQARRTGQPLIDTRAYRAMNDRAWAERKDWTWDAVEQAVTQGLNAVELQLNALRAEELVDPKYFTLEPDRPAPRPLLHNVVYELIDHPNHHFVGLYRKFADEAAITALFTRSLQTLGQLGSARWSTKTRKAAEKHAQRLQVQNNIV